MLELTGKYNNAKIFTDCVDEESIKQVLNLLNQPFVKDSKIRMMPDIHAGAGCTIGTTMTIHDYVVPNLVGVDIGCGMLTVGLNTTEIYFKKLDETIRQHIPSGMNIRNEVYERSQHFRKILENLICKDSINLDRAMLSLGTLGGGNHFIEVDEDDNGAKYLVIHSGSRYLGKQVCEYYQDLAYRRLNDDVKYNEIKAIIEQLKKEGRQSEIEGTLKRYHSEKPKVQRELAYLTGNDMRDYLHDMEIVQDYADENRYDMFEIIRSHMGFDPISIFTTRHNYIHDNVLRKGAVSAHNGEILLIPINMAEGSLICRGKGNPDWNCSAPHGAGRILSRSSAKQSLSLDEYKERMSKVYSTSVCFNTLDESPMAYKSMSDIVDNIEPTVEILKKIRPVYNYKNTDGE